MKIIGRKKKNKIRTERDGVKNEGYEKGDREEEEVGVEI